ncbi:SDR family NAD(P)-dependent oxidoreductase [uncultured Pseudokineococcus sp.]|uniref:SDR family NAD(P)-dependent oxidoreductase n=1 Tax=uncultured Pseudokineococcus sp. TaxID=1642928 RepID=UPI00262EDB0C|nr:SDR family NAD(P)-dependent oxidoreductase [uncultured Pseudokineococcus sp.]
MTRAWPPTPLPSLAGHHVVITGGTGGIGLRTAQALAAAGASVTVGARSHRKGEEATAAIRAAAGGAATVAHHMLLDLADLDSVRACATELARRGDPIDVLVNCAGVMAIPERELTTDGFERHWGTNHLGHFALTGLLLPLMGTRRRSRVVTVSAQAARTARLDPDDWQSERSYAPMRAYSRSKLANILFAVELNQHVSGADVLSLPVHPGTAQTGIQQHQRGAVTKWAGRQIMRVLGQPLDRVAEPLTYAATAPTPRTDRLITPSGLLELGGPPHLADLPPAAHDTDLRQMLWQDSTRLTDVPY